MLDKELINLNIQPLVLNQHIKKLYFELIKMDENKELNEQFLVNLNELILKSKEILHESLAATDKKRISPNTNVDVFNF